MPFQTSVGVTAAPFVAGDFVSNNPRAVYLAGPGGLLAGAAGVTVGAFAWVNATAIDSNNSGAYVTSYGQGPVAGFVAREQNAVTTAWLADSTMVIPSGLPVTLYTVADVAVINSGATAAVPGQYAYANLASGAVTFAAANAASVASGSTSTIAAATFSVTGSISGNVLTVTAVSSGTIHPGATISGTSVSTGSKIVSQLSGTTGGIGTYAVTLTEQSVASTTISGTYGLLTVGGTVAGTFVLGGLLAGTNVVAGTYLTDYISGAGGAGTYAVSNNTAVSSTSISSTTNVQTKWIAQSAGAAGEPVIISSYVLG